ncbi:MAG: universal stress protein [Gemmatimonadales bacterium]
MKRRGFGVLIATDGSPSARAAVSTAARFPWPEDTETTGLLVRRIYAEYGSAMSALEEAEEVTAEKARATLRKRWPAAQVEIVSGLPVDTILSEAQRLRTDVIVMGWRGHSAIRRVVAGSVSRGVVRSARCSVLVVRRAPTELDRIVIGFDGSAHAQRAVDLVAKLSPPRGGRVTLLTVADIIRDPPSHALLPSRKRAAVARDVRRSNDESVKIARRALLAPARALTAAGWKVEATVTTGAPLEDLLKVVGDGRAHVLAVGARGTGGVKQLLVGSVADGALDRSPVPVLIAR